MSWLESTDVALFRFANHSLSCPFLDQVVPIFSGFPLFMPAVILAGVLLLWKGGRRERMFVIMLAVALAIGESVLIAPLKELLGRPRPFMTLLDTHLLVGKAGSGSMPSSHASNLFAATMVAFLFYRRSWVVMLPLAVLVGFSRMYVGVHYPSDVLAGALLGAGYAIVCVLGLNALWRRFGAEWFPQWWQRVPDLVPPTPPETCSADSESGVSPVANRQTVGTHSQPQDKGTVTPALQNDSVSAIATAPLEKPGSAITDSQWLRLGYVTIAVLFVVQLWYLSAGKIQLSGDEAYQWLWSKHLALSYYSKPPMIAYLQFVGTSLWGDNELGVRFFSPVIASILCLLLLRFFAREVNARAGFWLVLIFHCTPMLAVGGTLMTVDPPLCLFWVAAMVAGWRAVQPGSTIRNWLWVGLWMGLGFLSKYSALFQLVCWGVFFALWPEARKQLRKPGPYLALLVIALCTVPVVIWNAQHGWITVRHVAVDNAGLGHEWKPTPKFLGEFLGAELGLLNPVFFCAMLWASVAFWRKYRGNPLFLYFFSMGAPVVLFYLLFTGYKRVFPNWIAPAVVPLFCLMVLYFDRVWREGQAVLLIKRWLFAGVILGALMNVFLHDTNLLNKVVGRSLPVPIDPLRRVRAWSDTAQAVGQARQRLLGEGKPVFIVAKHYDLAGHCSFYIPEARKSVNTNPFVYCTTEQVPSSQLFFWPGYTNRHGENAIFVQELDYPRLGKAWFGKWLRGDPDLYRPYHKPDAPPGMLTKEFESVSSLGIVEIPYRGRVFRRIELFACRNLH